MHDKNYITAAGYAQLNDELQNLLRKERPEYVKLVNWAASNGDRSENADYQYGKKKLREIDKRIYQLSKKIEHAEVVDPKIQRGKEVVFFGAQVTILRNQTSEQTLLIVGQDEIDPASNKISWTSPLARALLQKSLGTTFYFQAPQGRQEIEIIAISYDY